jgi:hypothetical protein
MDEARTQLNRLSAIVVNSFPYKAMNRTKNTSIKQAYTTAAEITLAITTLLSQIKDEETIEKVIAQMCCDWD